MTSSPQRKIHPAPARARLKKLQAVGATVTAVLMAASPLSVAAQDNFPSRPLTLIAPLAPGSAGDIAMRELANEMTNDLGQPVSVHNMTGAGGNIGTAAIARAKPDGYTFGMGGQGAMVINQFITKNPGFDTLKDIAPIALPIFLWNVMVVSESSPHKSVQDVIDAAKSADNPMTYSSSGVGSSMHMAGAVFSNMIETPMLHVPYTGAPQAMNAIVAGDVDTGFFNIAAARPFIEGKRLRPLAVTGSKRSSALPDLPTLNESGLEGYEVGTWVGLIAPAGTPAPIIEKLHASINKAFSKPELREKLMAMGNELAPVPLGSSEDYADVIQKDFEKWPPLIKAIGLEAQ